MPSTAEVNAAFDAIESDLRKLVVEFVPYMFQQDALSKLASRDGRRLVVGGVQKALAAAEAVRGKA